MLKRVFVKSNGKEIPAKTRWLWPLGWTGTYDPMNYALEVFERGKWRDVGRVGEFDQGIGWTTRTVYYFEF